MINLQTLLSTFDEKGTLLKWLKKVEAALSNASLETVQVVVVDATHIKMKFVFADGTSVESPSITLPRGPQGAQGETGEQGPQGPTGPTGPQGEAGIVSLESLIALLEGSEFISVDLNEQSTKVRIELDMTNVDNAPTANSGNLVKSGGIFDALVGKLDASKNAVETVGGLVTPTQAPSVVEIVGIDSTGAQVRIQVDTNDFEIDGTISPYTLKKKAEPQPETWIINNDAFANNVYNNKTYTALFNSNSQTFNSIIINNNPMDGGMFYDSTKVVDPENASTFINQAYRTVTFETAPTGELLTWLQANAVKQ